MIGCNTETLREIFSRGLVVGLGDEHQTCIEGAISLACGLPLTDAPPCVATPDWTTSDPRAVEVLTTLLGGVS